MVDKEKKISEGYQEIADGVFISPEEQVERLKWEIECTRKEILQICKEARIIYKEVLDMGEEDDSSEVA